MNSVDVWEMMMGAFALVMVILVLGLMFAIWTSEDMEDPGKRNQKAHDPFYESKQVCMCKKCKEG